MQALGFPLGRTLGLDGDAGSGTIPAVSTTSGSISAMRADTSGEQRRMQRDANVNPGNSGGPVVDRDRFAVDVVFARVTKATGIGLAIPINEAKDFLVSHGLASLMPVRRLRLGPVHRLDDKGVAVRMPDGAADVSPRRVRVETDPSQMDVMMRIDRVLSPWTLTQIEEALVRTQAFERFTHASGESRLSPVGSGAPSLLGRPLGTYASARTSRLSPELRTGRLCRSRSTHRCGQSLMCHGVKPMAADRELNGGQHALEPSARAIERRRGSAPPLSRPPSSTGVSAWWRSISGSERKRPGGLARTTIG